MKVGRLISRPEYHLMPAATPKMLQAWTQVASTLEVSRWCALTQAGFRCKLTAAIGMRIVPWSMTLASRAMAVSLSNGGSKSTAMRQELQMHQLYRYSLGLWGAEMRRNHDLYVDGVLKHLHLIQWCVLQQSLCLRSVHQSKHSRASSS